MLRYQSSFVAFHTGRRSFYVIESRSLFCKKLERVYLSVSIHEDTKFGTPAYNVRYNRVIDQAWCHLGWILAKFFLRSLKTSRIRDQGQCSTVLAKQAWPINDLLHGVATSVFLRDTAGYCEPTMQHLSLLCSQSQIGIWIILLACEYTLPPLIHSRYYVRFALSSGSEWEPAVFAGYHLACSPSYPPKIKII